MLHSQLLTGCQASLNSQWKPRGWRIPMGLALLLSILALFFLDAIPSSDAEQGPDIKTRREKTLTIAGEYCIKDVILVVPEDGMLTVSDGSKITFDNGGLYVFGNTTLGKNVAVTSTDRGCNGLGFLKSERLIGWKFEKVLWNGKYDDRTLVPLDSLFSTMDPFFYFMLSSQGTLSLESCTFRSCRTAGRPGWSKLLGGGVLSLTECVIEGNENFEELVGPGVLLEVLRTTIRGSCSGNRPYFFSATDGIRIWDSTIEITFKIGRWPDNSLFVCRNVELLRSKVICHFDVKDWEGKQLSVQSHYTSSFGYMVARDSTIDLMEWQAPILVTDDGCISGKDFQILVKLDKVKDINTGAPKGQPQPDETILGETGKTRRFMAGK